MTLVCFSREIWIEVKKSYLKVLSSSIHMKFPAFSRKAFLILVNDSDLNYFKLLKPHFSETLLKHIWKNLRKKKNKQIARLASRTLVNFRDDVIPPHPGSKKFTEMHTRFPFSLAWKLYSSRDTQPESIDQNKLHVFKHTVGLLGKIW